MALFEPSLPSTQVPNENSYCIVSPEAQVSDTKNSDNAFELSSITYVTAVIDLTTSASQDPPPEPICLPLLEAKKDEQIEIVDRYSPSIWVGLIAGRQGAFLLDHTVKPLLGKRVRALYDWTPSMGENGLTFKKWDVIEVIAPHDEWIWWFWGKLNGTIDLVPFNFVEPLMGRSGLDSNETSVEEHECSSTKASPLRVRALHSFEALTEGDLSFIKGDIIVVLDKGHDGWWNGSLDGQCGTFPSNYVTFSIVPRGPIIHAPPWYPYYVRTLYPYPSIGPEELSFGIGEIIEVYEMKDEPWLEGRKRNGQRGVFPASYTLRVLDRRQFTS